MQKYNIRETVESLVNPIIESENIELVDIEYKKEGREWYLKIFIDKNGGVKIDDCQNISYQIEKLLDVEDVIPHAYILEVSSPGVERPLKKIKDYIRFKNSLVEIYLYSPVYDKKYITGKIVNVENDVISIEEKGSGKLIKIMFGDISRGHLKFEFK